MCLKAGKEAARTEFQYGLNVINEDKENIARCLVPFFMPALWSWHCRLFFPSGATVGCTAGRTPSGGDQGCSHRRGETLPDLKEGLGVNDAVERVEIDTSAVDTGTAGEYPIIYRYTDVQGYTHEIRTICTVTVADSTETVQRPEKEHVPDKKETVRTTAPQTGDWTAFVGYAALFLVSIFLFLLLFLHRCFFG